MVEAPPKLAGRRLRCAYRRLYGWAAERLYHEFAWAYEAVAWLVSLGHWDAWRGQVLEHVPPGARVLEVGFGTGALLVRAAKRGLDVWGADPSGAMQRIAGHRLRRHGLVGRCVRAPSQGLPFADGAFDAILSTFPTQYIVDPATLRELARLLSGSDDAGCGGRLIITGLGFRVESSRRERLVGLVFGGASEDSVALYTELAEAQGFAVTIVDCASGSVRVPVLILEKTLHPPVGVVL